MSKKTIIFLVALGSLALILLLAGTINTFFTGDDKGNYSRVQENTPVQPDSYADLLYIHKDTYTGNNSAVGAIIQALQHDDLSVKSFELQTENQPYGITVNYEVENRAKQPFNEDIEAAWNKNAAIMFSLIPNADELYFRLYDSYGDFAGGYYNRDYLKERYGMEYFTPDAINAAADNLDSFGIYLNKVAAIRNPQEFYSELQLQNIERAKQIYELIGEDREITTNSGVAFPLILTKEFISEPPLAELVEQKDSLAPYVDQEVDFIIYNIRNYKTNHYTYYLFVFSGTEMCAYADLKTDAAERKAIKILRSLE